MKRIFGVRRSAGRPGWRRYVGVTGLVAVAFAVSIALVGGAASRAGNPSAGAGYTTVDESLDGTGHCQNGNPNVNCNIYDGKQYVWMNGGPVSSSLGDGTYFFAVIAPGGQADPNDGSAKLLSTDLHDNRTFTVTGDTVSYSGSHDIDGNKIRLLPYDDTPNPGGVYIMAICSLADGYPVDPSTCKYDAFKIQEQGTVTPPASSLSVTKDAEGAYTTTWTWGITKDVDKTEIDQSGTSATFHYTVNVTHDTGTDSGVAVTGTITVTNPNADGQSNTIPVDISGVADELSDGTICDVTDGGPQTLSAFKTQFSYVCHLDAVPLDALTNTATVTWGDQFLDDGAFLAGSHAEFTFPTVGGIEFTQTKVDDSVSVTDPLGGGTLGTVSESDSSPTTFKYSNEVDGTAGTCTSVDNTATFTTDTTQSTGSDSKTVKLCVGEDLGVGKTADTAFTRTYNWTINKSVVGNSLIRTSNSTATFNYKVVVNSATPAYTDSGWTVSGTITVSNPNDWEDIVATITDSIGTGWSCSVTNGASQTVPMSGSIQRSYSCSWTGTGSPAATGTNTATATWDAAGANTPDGSATGTAGFAFSAPTTSINKTITITDPAYSGGTPPGTLGTVTYGVTVLPKTFTYSHTISVDPNQCTTYPNTATITETGQNSSASVKACPTVSGLTMGYWQNKNGQTEILNTGGGSSASSCLALYNYLAGFRPFTVAIAGVPGIASYGSTCGNSLSLTKNATSSGVAGFVYDVIKAANAGNATMAAMLRAQMLATALNVYAHHTSSTVLIDLQHGCKMADQSNGTGSCNGSEDWRPAFNNQSSMTVPQMLSWVAGEYNDKGTTSLSDDEWYPSNSKTLQGLAKDAFDAINNSAALAF